MKQTIKIFLLLLQLFSFPSFTEQRLHKNFFNMKDLALFSAALTTINKEKDIVYFYKIIAYKCLFLTKIRYFKKLEYITKKFHILYHSYKKIRAINLITFNDKRMKNYLKRYYHRFIGIDLFKILNDIYSTIYKKKMSSLENAHWKKKLKLKNRKSVHEKMIKFQLVLRRIIYISFRLFYSGFQTCKIVPKRLRKYSKSLLKNKGRNLSRLLYNKTLYYNLLEGMYKVFKYFKMIRLTDNNNMLIKMFKLIAKFFLKFYKKD